MAAGKLMDAQAAHDLAMRIAARFATVDGVVGIVLGGSAASDPGNTVAALKAMVANYPDALRSTIVRQSLFEARFALENAATAAARADAVYVAGCFYRCAASLTQAIFALNSTYLMNEKGAVARSDQLRVRPPKFGAVPRAVMGRPGDTAERLLASIDKMSLLTTAVEQLWDNARES